MADPKRRARAEVKHGLGAVGFALSVFAEQHVESFGKGKRFLPIISEIAQGKSFNLHFLF